MISYIESVIVPYMTEKRKQLGLDAKYTGLVIQDEFKGQTTTKVLNLLRNNLPYVIVPPKCTDCLQSIDVSVNWTAKQLLRNKFENWNADNIAAQKSTSKAIEWVDVILSVVKLMAAKWMTELYDYFVAHPEIIKNMLG